MYVRVGTEFSLASDRRHTTRRTTTTQTDGRETRLVTQSPSNGQPNSYMVDNTCSSTDNLDTNEASTVSGTFSLNHCYWHTGTVLPPLLTLYLWATLTKYWSWNIVTLLWWCWVAQCKCSDIHERQRQRRRRQWERCRWRIRWISLRSQQQQQSTTTTKPSEDWYQRLDQSRQMYVARWWTYK